MRALVLIQRIDDPPGAVAPGVDARQADYRLELGSPSIDTGLNAAVPAGIAADLDGVPRFVRQPVVRGTTGDACPLVDMGAYERQGGAIHCCSADIDSSGDVDFDDILLILHAWGDDSGPPDLDGSGLVGFEDLLLALTTWGPCS